MVRLRRHGLHRVSHRLLHRRRLRLLRRRLLGRPRAKSKCDLARRGLLIVVRLLG